MYFISRVSFDSEDAEYLSQKAALIILLMLS